MFTFVGEHRTNFKTVHLGYNCELISNNCLRTQPMLLDSSVKI